MNEDELKQFEAIRKRQSQVESDHSEQLAEGKFIKLASTYIEEHRWLIDQLLATGAAEPPDPRPRRAVRKVATEGGEGNG